MALRDPFMPMYSDLNAFLFAQMGEDKSGMAVTVASAIARAGIDPWEEAARIASLSRSAAIQVLMPMITRSFETVGPVDARETADRLVRLLPKAISMPSRGSGRRMPSISPLAIWLTCLAVSVGLLFWTMKEPRTLAEDQSPASLSSGNDRSRTP